MSKAIVGSFKRGFAGLPQVEVPQGWVAISHHWIPDIQARRWLTGSWFKIESDYGTIYRTLRFAADLPGTPARGVGTIAIDWPGWLRLSGYSKDTDKMLELRLTPSSPWMFWAWMISHPEPSLALAGMISLISLALGVISLIVSF